MTPEIFKKDWFDGRTIEAISADDSKRIGWDDQLSNYSEFLFDENHLERLLKDKELIVEELDKILAAMDVTASIGFSNKANTAYTDGSRIIIDNKFVPNDHINQIILSDMILIKTDADGFHHQAQLCVPDSPSSYVVDVVVSADGKMVMKEIP